MSRSSGRSVRRTAIGLAGMAGAALIAGLAAAPSTAAAPGSTTQPAPEQGGIEVRLTAQTPLEPRPGDVLTMSGYVVNRSDAAAEDVAVRLRVSPTPVRSRSEIDQILAGDAGRTGISVTSTLTPVADRLAPGGRTAFTFSVPFDELGLPSSAQVVVLGVESIADVEDDGSGAVQTGFVRTFLPWFPDPSTVDPTRVVMLLPLSTAPARSGTGVFLDDHLGEEVAPDGRLARLLSAGEADPAAVSWVVDPQLLEALQDMADGYDVRSGDDVVPGTHGPDAAAWLARLTAATANGDVTASAYGLPDVVALHRAGMDLDIALSATTASDVPGLVLGRPVAGGLAWPQRGLTDDGTLDALRAAGARSVVLSAAQLPPSPPLTYTPSGSVDLAGGGSPLRAALADRQVSALVAAPTRAPRTALQDEVVRRQTALAHVAMTTLELPTSARTLVIGPDTWLAPDGTSTRDVVTTLTSPWSTPWTLSRLTTTEPSTVARDRVDYPNAARRAELPQSYLASVQRARGQLAGLRSVAPDTDEPVTAGIEAALTRTESGYWRRDIGGGRELLASVAAELGSQVGGVSVLSRAPVTLPGDSGLIPVTVANDLDRPARVGVRLTGTPAVRFEADDVAPVTIAPGQKQTLEVQARVLGTGPVAVQIALLTPEGDVFGTPVTTEVRSAAYARAAQGVVIGLFGILVVLLAVNFVRRRRAARPEGGGA